MRRTIAGIGRTLVTLGLLILLFVVYQLWGTGIWTARAQEQLEKDFAQAQHQYEEDNPVITTPATGTKPTKPAKPLTRPAPPIPDLGQWEGKIAIPKIGLNVIFVEGTGRDELKKGPGHYPGTPMPGTFGNAAIAGHRTTYLHPFGDVDKLNPGDEILIETLAGKFTYEVYAPNFGHPEVGHLIVSKTDTYVVANTKLPELTLTSCHPKGSAEQRIVIKAKLVANKSSTPSIAPKPKAHPKGQTQADTLEEGLSGQHKSLVPSIMWGVVALLVGVGWWWAFRRWRHPATWILGVVPFIIVLFPFYVYLERALPAGY